MNNYLIGGALLAAAILAVKLYLLVQALPAGVFVIAMVVIAAIAIEVSR